jgi:hypothetical protein
VEDSHRGIALCYVYDFVQRESKSRHNYHQQQLHQCPKRFAVADFQCPLRSRFSHQSRHKNLAPRAACLVNTVPRRTSRNTLKNKANTLYHNRPHTVSKSLRERHPRRLNGLCSQTMLTGGSSGTSCRGWQLGWLSRARARPLNKESRGFAAAPPASQSI